MERGQNITRISYGKMLSNPLKYLGVPYSALTAQSWQAVVNNSKLMPLVNSASGKSRQIGPKGRYVYFAVSGDAIKIGFSTQPHVRWHQLNPRARNLWMIGVVPGWPSDEIALHDRFDHLRLDLYGEREWFRPAPELVQFIDGLASSKQFIPWDEYLARRRPPPKHRFHKLEEIRMKQHSDDFPRDLDKFKTWADAACTTWPEHLTRAAYNAPLDGFAEFEAAYRNHVLSGSSA